MLDYLARNMKFWRHYYKDIRLKYVFFVRGGLVARVRFRELLTIATAYARDVARNRNLDYRRTVAGYRLRSQLKYR